MLPNQKLIAHSPQEFVAYLRTQGIRRFHFVTDSNSGNVVASHDQLRPIAAFLQNDGRDFMAHEGLFFQITREHDILQGAFVHRTVRGMGAGGVRFWQYDSVEAFLRDGLRLSRGMTRKNALAGLWWGGGKGVMAHNPAVDKHDPAVRQAIFREYGELMTALRGCYVTAEDVGTHVEDMANIFARTRFTTCIPPELGGSGNPSVPTARGVICGMEAALNFAGRGDLRDKVVAVQGMGNVGGPLIAFLFEKGVRKIIASDIDARRVARLRDDFPEDKLRAKAVDLGDHSVLAAECDIVSPCATGGVLNPQTIPQIRAKIVCGAANNQLEDSARDDALLHEQGILYVPDFLTNRMGIVNCANEQVGYVTEDPLVERHLSRDWEQSIYQTALRVLAESRETARPPAQVAIQLADDLALQPHPIFGHRGQLIVDSLVADRWYANDG